MLYLPNAYTNDNIEVLNVSDSHKLYSILDEKQVIVEFTGMWQPVEKSGGKWRQTTGKIVSSCSFVWISDVWKKVQLEEGAIF
jgi:hypothetical protein